MYKGKIVHKKAKLYTERYLYFVAVVGGILWAVFFWWNDTLVETKSLDYIYEQQQSLSREVNSLKQKIAE